ncbi:hypothetical protein P3T35_000902 [Kitasatospora sp. GP30]|nr:hypothetical protein [Kitasatospora sp. GP30]
MTENDREGVGWEGVVGWSHGNSSSIREWNRCYCVKRVTSQDTALPTGSPKWLCAM